MAHRRHGALVVIQLARAVSGSRKAEVAFGRVALLFAVYIGAEVQGVYVNFRFLVALDAALADVFARVVERTIG